MRYLDLEIFLSKRIKHSKINIIGQTMLKRSIYSVEFDFESDDNVIIQGAIHAREHITTDLICRLIKNVERNYDKYKALKTPNIIFVPMVNPDGVELCYDGVKSVKSKILKTKLININNGSKDFLLYKANANGVDLNVNFDAKWGSGRQNKFLAASSDYIGESPMSENETKALAMLTVKKKAVFTISYHAKGEEIYYQFFNKPENIRRDKKIAKIIARNLKYKIKNTESVSSGGYKDWCVLRLNIPSVTIEVGKDSLLHPIENKNLNQIYKRNKNIIKILHKIIKEIKNHERIIYERGIKRSL